MFRIPEQHDGCVEPQPLQIAMRRLAERFAEKLMEAAHAEAAMRGEIGDAQRKSLPKRKVIAEWLEPAIFSDAQFTVRFVGAAEGRALTHSYRHKDYATNVLPCAYGEEPDGVTVADLVLCCPVVEKEAREQGKTLVAHYAHLLVHGALHAQGYDHERGEEDAAEMEALEIDILAKLGFPNPYR